MYLMRRKKKTKEKWRRNKMSRNKKAMKGLARWRNKQKRKKSRARKLGGKRRRK